MNAPGNVLRSNNRIRVSGHFDRARSHRALGLMHDCVGRRGYDDFELDFSECTSTFAPQMVALCAQVLRLRREGRGVSLVLPRNAELAHLFVNANWASLLDPRQPRSDFVGLRHVPAHVFHSATGHAGTVDKLLEGILTSATGYDRHDLSAIDWALSEITENVLRHAESGVGGIAQLTAYDRRVEYVVADAGRGIPASLKPRYPGLTEEALVAKSLEEGVTRDPAIGQGNGLFGARRVSLGTGSYFLVFSSYGDFSHYVDAGGRELIESRRRTVPYKGTVVVGSIALGRAGALASALRFASGVYSPMDSVEARYEDKSSDDIVVRLRDEVELGRTRGREGGEHLRHRIGAWMRLCPTQRIVIDCTGVSGVSSSFADECFGKLHVELGAVFASRVVFRAADDELRVLLDRGLHQRRLGGAAVE